jgi:hypothetical protein
VQQFVKSRHGGRVRGKTSVCVTDGAVSLPLVILNGTFRPRHKISPVVNSSRPAEVDGANAPQRSGTEQTSHGRAVVVLFVFGLELNYGEEHRSLMVERHQEFVNDTQASRCAWFETFATRSCGAARG